MQFLSIGSDQNHSDNLGIFFHIQEIDSFLKMWNTLLLRGNTKYIKFKDCSASSVTRHLTFPCGQSMDCNGTSHKAVQG